MAKRAKSKLNWQLLDLFAELDHQPTEGVENNNPYLQIARQFLRDHPQLFKESTPETKEEMLGLIANQVLVQVRALTPAIAESQITLQMTQEQIEGVTNMAKMRAEEVAFHEVMYAMLEP